MRKYWKDTIKFATWCIFTLLCTSIIDGFLIAYFPSNTFIIVFDRFLSMGISPLLIFLFGIAIGEIDKIKSKIE